MRTNRTPIRIQRNIAVLAVILFLGKIYAWYLTHSVAVLTDALESTVNVIAGFIGLYSIILASKPRDLNHPYGHGKAQFVSSAVEGALITIAGLFIIYEAIAQFVEAKPLHKLDIGLLVILSTGTLNFLLGLLAIKSGKKNRSIIVESAGRHLLSDGYSTFGITVGLFIVFITGLQWLDSLIALVFAAVIIITGYRVLRKSLAGIMDEADEQLLREVVSILQNNRNPQWIDMHNLRVIQYGEVLHIDTHLTLPWYYRVNDAEKEIHAVEEMAKQHFEDRVELFIHIDACMPYSCKLCSIPDCAVRREAFANRVEWNLANLSVDRKHGKPVFAES